MPSSSSSLGGGGGGDGVGTGTGTGGKGIKRRMYDVKKIGEDGTTTTMTVPALPSASVSSSVTGS